MMSDREKQREEFSASYVSLGQSVAVRRIVSL